jgi:hypothetical protein
MSIIEVFVSFQIAVKKEGLRKIFFLCNLMVLTDFRGVLSREISLLRFKRCLLCVF